MVGRELKFQMGNFKWEMKSYPLPRGGIETYGKPLPRGICQSLFPICHLKFEIPARHDFAPSDAYFPYSCISSHRTRRQGSRRSRKTRSL